MHAYLYTDRLHGLIFNPDMTYTIQGLLADEDEFVQCQTLDTLVAFMNHSESFSLIITHTYRCTDGLYGIIFTPGMISAIHSKLTDTHRRVRIQALKTLVASLDHSENPFVNCNIC
jgi:hypothetical protein